MAQPVLRPGASPDLVIHTLHCSQHAREHCNPLAVAVEFEAIAEIVGVPPIEEKWAGSIVVA